MGRAAAAILRRRVGRFVAEAEAVEAAAAVAEEKRRRLRRQRRGGEESGCVILSRNSGTRLMRISGTPIHYHSKCAAAPLQRAGSTEGGSDPVQFCSVALSASANEARTRRSGTTRIESRKFVDARKASAGEWC